MYRFWHRPAAVVGLASLLLGLAIVAESTGGGKEGTVKEGQPAPAVELPATQIGTALPDKKDAKTMKLQDFKGKKHVVLYFFPKALTGGWTAEACAFRDRIEQFAQLETVVVGISTDPLQLQQKFTDKEKLNFPLYADPEGTVAKTFGVMIPGKTMARRSTFVINKQGTIAKIFDPVKSAGDHPEEVLQYVKTNLKK